MASAGVARRWATLQLGAWGLKAIADDACLVISELVANAVLHGRGQVLVVLQRLSGGVRIEVCDEGDGQVAVVGGPVDRPTGRGLVIVERLSAAWGVEPVDGGSSVWAELMVGVGG